MGARQAGVLFGDNDRASYELLDSRDGTFDTVGDQRILENVLA